MAQSKKIVTPLELGVKHYKTSINGESILVYTRLGKTCLRRIGWSRKNPTQKQLKQQKKFALSQKIVNEIAPNCSKYLQNYAKNQHMTLKNLLTKLVLKYVISENENGDFVVNYKVIKYNSVCWG